MPKVSTNISLDADMKKASILKQSLRVQGIPFAITRGDPETMAALNEYYEMKKHPENYRRYASFQEAMNEVLSDEV